MYIEVVEEVEIGQIAPKELAAVAPEVGSG
jgi:hypothetical protein